MKHGLSRTLALIGLGLATFAVTPANAQTTGVGPYYATPSWDQTLPANTRFIVLTNFNSEAVLDRETGLVWQRSPGTTELTWALARSECLSKTIATRKGWRLPTANEVSSLLDLTVERAPGAPIALPAGHPFLGAQKRNYWTSTIVIDDPTLTWIVNFEFGSLGLGRRVGDPMLEAFAWCVRGPLSADAQ